MEDDVYKGKFIPKGSLIFGNIWYVALASNSSTLDGFASPTRQESTPNYQLIIAPNFRTMCRNEELYPDPDTFNPERFMEKVDDETRRKRNPRNFVFGFGRR